MNKDKYVFAQLVEFLDNNKFRHLVDKYDGNRYVKSFTCWNHIMALMFGQLCNHESFVMLSLHWRLTNPSVTTLAWDVIQ